MNKQTTAHIMMVRPAHFGFNEETAANNSFQQNDKGLDPKEIETRAKAEFDQFVNTLRAHGIQVFVVEDSSEPVKPDAVFPNNWITLHEDGTLITYPMYSPKRRHERREEIIKKLQNQFFVRQHLRFESAEAENRFLEGTGSMIFDRANQVVYACLSPRTDQELLDHFCQRFNCRKVCFNAVNEKGIDIYHTNVMMAVGETFVVICMDTILNAEQRTEVLQAFADTNKTVIEISLEQMKAFAGNMLQVRNTAGETFLVMSAQAYHSLSANQIQAIKEHTNILYSPIETIEKYGGGSARCMMAEIFLPVLEGQSA